MVAHVATVVHVPPAAIVVVPVAVVPRVVRPVVPERGRRQGAFGAPGAGRECAILVEVPCEGGRGESWGRWGFGEG